MKKTRVVLLALSVALNIAFASAFACAMLSKPRSVLFPGLADNRAAAACIVSLPAENASVSFGAAEITLRRGETAEIQHSLIRAGGQLNLAVDPLYDRAVVSVERTGYGIAVRALAPGRCLLQAFASDGIKSFAVITVAE